jgi:uncharacterized protein
MAEAKAQETAKQDPKAGAAAAGEDLSMEEILHSIRKIIAEDDPEARKPNGKPKEGEAAAAAPASEDVLELTEMVKEDGSIESLKPGAPADILQSIDKALEKPAEKPVEKPVEKVAEKSAEKSVEEGLAAKPTEPAPVSGALLSSEAAASASASFKKLKTAEPEQAPVATTPAPVFRSGLTVEDMVVDMLKPMMKDWLDKNLPQIVERIVEREVKKLTQ